MHLDDVLTELVEHSGDRLLRVAYQLPHDAAAAQDLVQEALLRVYRSVRHRGRPQSPPWWRAAYGPAAFWVATSRHRPPAGPSRSSASCPARRATLIRPPGCLP